MLLYAAKTRRRKRGGRGGGGQSGQSVHHIIFNFPPHHFSFSAALKSGHIHTNCTCLTVQKNTSGKNSFEMLRCSNELSGIARPPVPVERLHAGFATISRNKSCWVFSPNDQRYNNTTHKLRFADFFFSFVWSWNIRSEQRAEQKMPQEGPA